MLAKTRVHDGDELVTPKRCPSEPGADSECAVVDRDGDGVRDPDDKCPDACEVLNGIDDDDGCPEPSPTHDPEVRAILGVINGLEFEADKSVIRPESVPLLEPIVTVLRKHPTVELEIAAHRNPDPSEYVGAVDITLRRATAVRDFLVSQGIEADRLISQGYSDSRPIASNDTEQGQAQNRRVELILLNPPPKVADGCVARDASLRL